MNELALFAGAGGGILGGHLLGWRTVCAVERDGYAAQVLAQRQNDGCLKPFPIWSDISTFDGRPWRGLVDVVSGGFPCQDISAAGKGAGIDGERSGLWEEMARVVREVQPRFVYVENSPMLTSRGLGRVLGDLAEMGFDAQWGVLGAHHADAPHERERIWVLADSGCQHGGAWSLNEQDESPSQWREKAGNHQRHSGWPTEPGLDRMGHGVANRMDRLKAIGNGQVPRVAKVAWLTLSPDNG
jgi:DNA (cytosine-5)-methyltransferase 1